MTSDLFSRASHVMSDGLISEVLASRSVGVDRPDAVAFRKELL